MTAICTVLILRIPHIIDSNDLFRQIDTVSCIFLENRPCCGNVLVARFVAIRMEFDVAFGPGNLYNSYAQIGERQTWVWNVTFLPSEGLRNVQANFQL